jgi:hypothetical protein
MSIRARAARSRVGMIAAALVLASPTATVWAQQAARAAPPAPGYERVEWYTLSSVWVTSHTVNTAVPRNVLALDSTQVRIVGYMLPFEFGGRGVTQFGLMSDLDACGYGENLNPTNWVNVYMPPGKSASYSNFDYIEVFGRFYVAPGYEDGQLVSMYWMQADSVKTR